VLTNNRNVCQSGRGDRKADIGAVKGVRLQESRPHAREEIGIEPDKAMPDTNLCSY